MLPEPQIIVVVLLPMLATAALADRLRVRARVKSVAPDRRGTTAVLAGCCGVALFALTSPVGGTLALPPWAQWTGVAVSLSGAMLYAWVLAARAGRTADASGTILPKGPYRLVRYPGYLSGLAIWSGMTAAGGSLIALNTVVVAMLAAYAVRISSEEDSRGIVFTSACGTFRRPSWRLIPFLF